MSNVDKDFASQLRHVAENMASWAAARSKYETIVAKLEALDIEPTWSSTYLYVGASGDKAKLTKVIRVLRTSGLKLDDPNNRPKANQPSYSAWLRSEDGEIKVYLSFSSTMCRRVQVGTEMQEVPLYKVICE